MAKKKLSDQQIQAIAESLLPSFIPKDSSENQLAFHFTAEGSHYQVAFEKEAKIWKFISCQEQAEE
ncbi:hypothetical protein [Desertivirga brevis]|uniref:hypothetical protein n=1 Tax=Desertivirga brevis TaxID=2810310 RepID=UPI001A97B9A2|nr:hypothetical protein [Pedobacter sp. SYSU D00873]